MFPRSASQPGSGSVIPFEPPVNPRKLSPSVCIRNRKAIVMMTNACSRALMIVSPSTTATTAATTPPSGASIIGDTSTYREMMPTVYAPRPRNALCPSETYPV
jgi:hypothetical protein